MGSGWLIGRCKFTEDWELQRSAVREMVREMRIRRIGEGPSEVQKHVIARDIIGASLR